MKKPRSNQNCEICNTVTPRILIDGRVKQGPHGNKGHWVYMCESCQVVWGLGTDEDNYIRFEYFNGRYFETRMGETDGDKISSNM